MQTVLRSAAGGARAISNALSCFDSTSAALIDGVASDSGFQRHRRSPTVTR
jgi:hypothetical protein